MSLSEYLTPTNQPGAPAAGAGVAAPPTAVRPAHLAVVSAPIADEIAVETEQPEAAASWGQQFLERYDRQVWRFGAIFPGAFTWFVISALFWGPLVAPNLLAVAVLLFNVYWLAR